MKPKAVMPSLREKKRYMVFEILSDKKIENPGMIAESIRKAALELLGAIDASKAGIMFLGEKYNAEKQKGIIRVNTGYLDKLRASLVLIKKVGNSNVTIKSISASGMINKAAEYI